MGLPNAAGKLPGFLPGVQDEQGPACVTGYNQGMRHGSEPIRYTVLLAEMKCTKDVAAFVRNHGWRVHLIFGRTSGGRLEARFVRRTQQRLVQFMIDILLSGARL